MHPPQHDRLTPLVAQISHLSMPEKAQLLQVLAGSLAEDTNKSMVIETPIAPARKEDEIKLEDLTFRIIGCAMAVHSRQGPGLREAVYQRDLEVHLEQAGLPFQPQHNIEVFDSKQGGKLVGYYIPDFIVANRVIVEIKAAGRLDNGHLAQVIGYLAITGCPVGLLIDFACRSLKWRRILPPRKLAGYPVNYQCLFIPENLKKDVG